MTKRDKYNYKNYNNRIKRDNDYHNDNHENNDFIIRRRHVYPTIIDKLVYDAKYFIHKYLNRNILNYVKILVTYIGKMVLPIVINLYDLYQKQVPKYFKDPKYSNNVKHNPDLNTNEKHRYFGFFMLMCEIYSLFFQDILLRLWIIANFAATLLFMYYDLNGINDNQNQNKNINHDIIRYYLLSVIISGIVLLLFFTSSIGFTSIPLMIYLLNRTIRNMIDCHVTHNNDIHNDDIHNNDIRNQDTHNDDTHDNDGHHDKKNNKE